MTKQLLPTAVLFGAYSQVSDLDRSMAFYRDVMGLEVIWNDRTLAVLHAGPDGENSLVLRLMEDAPHHVGDSGVTRLLWRVQQAADLDVAAEVLATHRVDYTRHKDESIDGLSFRDPDGLEVVLIDTGKVKHDKTPPPWLYWTH